MASLHTRSWNDWILVHGPPLALPRHVLLKVVCAAAGLSPELHELEVRERTPVIEIYSSKRRARRRIVDLLLTVHTKDGRTVLVIVIEVQLSFDSNKRWDWPMVHVAFAAQFQAPAVLAAFIPEPQLREKIREKLGSKLQRWYDAARTGAPGTPLTELLR